MTTNFTEADKTEFDPMRADTNNYIVEIYNQLVMNRDIMKELKVEKKEKINEDEKLLAIITSLTEYNNKIKPLKEKFKVAKEEFKSKNKEIFEKEALLKSSDLSLKRKLATAYAIKEANKDESPILIGNGKRELIINLTPSVKKQKV